MKLSLKTKVVSATILIVAITVVAITAFLQVQIEKNLKSEQESDAISFLNTLLTTVENHYQNLQYYEKSITEERKHQLENIVAVSLEIVDGWYKKSSSGKISEATAKREAVALLNAIRYQDNIGYVWINDTTRPFPTMIMHPTIPNLDNTVLDSPEFNCALGKGVNLFRAFADITEKKGEGYVDYLWPKPQAEDSTKRYPKLSFVKKFNPWGWIIGTGLYIDDIEKNVDIYIEALKSQMEWSIRNTRVMNTGYGFIFDNTGHLIAHPLYRGDEAKDLKNPSTGNLIFDDLRNAAKHPEGKISYVWNKPGEKSVFKYKKTAYIAHFKPFDWYVVSSFYEGDIQDQIAQMRYKTIFVALIIILIALIFAILFSNSLTNPLLKIMELSSRGTAGDYSQRLTINRKDEVGALADNFNKFMDQIENSRKELLQSEKKFRTLFEKAADAQMIIHKGKVISCNKSAVEMFKCPNKSFIINKSIIELSPKEQNSGGESEALFKGFLEELQREEIVQFEWDYTIYNGGVSISEIQMTQINELIHLRMRDIAKDKQVLEEKQRAEAQLIQMQKMETIGTLAGGFAHDFNNILAGIVGTLDLMEFDMESTGAIAPEKLQKYISTMDLSGKRAEKMVSHLLALSRKQSLEFNTVDLRKSIKNVVVLAKGSLDKSVNLEVEYPEDKVLIYADAPQLEQAILNFFVNGAHAMTIMRDKSEKWGGTLKVDISAVSATEEFCAIHQEAQVGEYWQLTISDTGVGMTQHTISKIFTPFYTTKDKGIGTGLGLAMVYNIVDQHNGFIYVYSEPGVGTTFDIYFPNISDSEVESAAEQMSATIHEGEGTILVIDDESLMRTMATEMLSKCGYSAITAKSGKEGIEIYKQNSTSIIAVILDMAMPELSGRETFIRLKEINENVKVLLASGFRQDERVMEVMRLGIKGFLQKPYRMADLSKAVAKMLGKKE